MCQVASFCFKDTNGISIFDTTSNLHIDTVDFIIKNKAEEDQTYYTVFQDTDSSYYFEIFIYQYQSMISDLYFHCASINVDTLRAHYIEKGNSTFNEKLYYNGGLIESKNHCEPSIIHSIIIKPD